MTKRRESAGGVVLNDGRIAVVRQRNDVWSLPKGHLKTGRKEGPVDAAVREIREETGLTRVTLVRELGSYERCRIGLDGKDDVSEVKEIRIFLFTTDQEHLEPEDAKIEDAVWLTPKKAVKRLTHPADREFLAGVLPGLTESPGS